MKNIKTLSIIGIVLFSAMIVLNLIVLSFLTTGLIGFLFVILNAIIPFIYALYYSSIILNKTMKGENTFSRGDLRRAKSIKSINELKKLHELKEKGVLTEEEFEAQKKDMFL